jgi:amidase
MPARPINFDPPLYFQTYARHEPALWVRPGATIRTPTLDARRGDPSGEPLPPDRFERRDDTQLVPWNPLSGAFCVEGAEPGDTLVCEIRKIELTRAAAYSLNSQGQVFFAGEGPAAYRHLVPADPVREYRWRLDAARTHATLAVPKSRVKQVTIPLHPFLGCIGTAPPNGRVEPSTAPGEYGGNMDAIETAAGATVYLPVFVRGGYLHLGDVHAAQGDGEFCGTALEIAARVTVRLGLQKGRALAWPRFENRTHIMTVANARPLEDAYGIAHRQMVAWLTSGFGFQPDDAVQVLSQVGLVRIGNVVDPNYTVVVKFPKRLLGKS